MELPKLKHDFQAEQGVIGCLMHAGRDGDEDSLSIVFDALKADDFFNADLRVIFAAARALWINREPVDPQLVAKKVNIDNAAGVILAAVDSVTGTALTGSYVKIVADLSRQRKAVQTAMDALSTAKGSGEVSAVVDVLRAGLESLQGSEHLPPVVTATQATDDYMRFLALRDHTMPRSAITELDFALGGGVDYGEMIVLAARPSHGKTAIALQCAHNWTRDGLSVLYVSLEMSRAALGKRIMQYSTNVPEEHWRRDMGDVRCDVEAHLEERAELFITDSLKTADQIAREVDRSVKQRGIKAAVIDYAQLIASPGKTRYEQITYTSTMLRGLASEHRILMLVLCQMSREIESRKKFVPIMSDIKESGQFEQDADVVVFLVWPHRIDANQPAHEYQFFVAKNRNRPILNSAFTARFEPSRQRVVSPRVQDMPNYEPAFEDHDPFANGW